MARPTRVGRHAFRRARSARKEGSCDAVFDGREIRDAVDLVAPGREDSGLHPDREPEGCDVQSLGESAQLGRVVEVAAAVGDENEISLLERTG
jgi:hypothetical protein